MVYYSALHWAKKAEKSVEECQNIKNSLGVIYEFKGSVQTNKDLPTNANVGDVYDVIESGNNYAWTGTEWDSLGLNVDLSEYAKKTDLNAKQDELVSGTNIKTVNGESVLGSGNILIKSAPDLDNKTITQNASSQLQAIGVIDQRTSSAVKTWTGTKAQYDALSSKDSNTLYNVTDDESSAIKKLNELIEQIPNQVNEAITNAQNQITNTLNKIYPIGSIYLTINSENPASLLGFGTWTQVSSGRVLQGADSSHTAGSTISAGLPNISGSLSNIWWKSDGKTSTNVSGAITTTGATNSYVGNSSGSGYAVSSLSFSASRSNSIYGSSTTVQPPAYVVNIWQRTA